MSLKKDYITSSCGKLIDGYVSAVILTGVIPET